MTDGREGDSAKNRHCVGIHKHVYQSLIYLFIYLQKIASDLESTWKEILYIGLIAIGMCEKMLSFS